METIAKEVGRTVRHALSDWPTTFRLLLILATLTALGLISRNLWT